MSIHDNLTSTNQDSGYDIQVVVKNILAELNDAFHKIRLYPPEHTIYQTSLKSLKKGLDDFLNQHEILSLKIDRNKILHENKVVHEGPMKEENLAFILFRDGIYLLEFHKLIELWEIQSFLEVLQKHQILTEYSENDIVTTLWKLKLPSLKYRADDASFYSDEDFEIPGLRGPEASECEYFEIPELAGSETFECASLENHYPKRSRSSGNESDTSATDARVVEPVPTLDTAIYDPDLWKITPEDQEILYRMLEEEKNWERIEYFLYVLLFLLQQQTQPDDFSKVLTFLYQEIQDSMKNQKYQNVYNILQVLRKDLDSSKAQSHWTVPLLEDFFASLSGKAFLNAIYDDKDRIDECDLEEIEYLKQALLLLNADAIGALVPILLDTGLNQIKGVLVEVIGTLAERDFERLESLLSSSNTDMLIMLSHIMGFMQNELSFTRLLELLYHSSEAVRESALRAICRRDPDIIVTELSWLMDDPDEGVKELFWKYATKHHDSKTASLLLDFLARYRITHDNKQFLFRLYISLGKCSSDEAIPFLKSNLFFLPGLNIMRPRKSLRRQAAVYALKELHTEKATSILNRESKRVFPPLGNLFIHKH